MPFGAVDDVRGRALLERLGRQYHHANLVNQDHLPEQLAFFLV